MKVTVRDAEAGMSKLIKAAMRGEEVLIADGDTHIVQLVPTFDETNTSRPKFKFGILPEDALGDIPDFLEPMSEEELALWEGGTASHPA